MPRTTQEIDLINGVNCAKASETREFIASKNENPYAFKTLLEWCIVGPMYSQNKSEKSSCRRIALKSEVKELPLNH